MKFKGQLVPIRNFYRQITANAIRSRLQVSIVANVTWGRHLFMLMFCRVAKR